MPTIHFDVCPSCGRKGWYISKTEYSQTFKLHRCRYCHSYELHDGHVNRNYQLLYDERGGYKAIKEVGK